MKSLILNSFLVGLAAVTLSACAEPKAQQVSPEAAASLKAEMDINREEQLAVTLSALSRKGEILDKIHEYQPFIRVFNVYINGSQTENGTYIHPQVVSVPLIFKDQQLKYSPATVESMFDGASTKGKYANPSTEPTTTTVTPTESQKFAAARVQAEQRDSNNAQSAANAAEASQTEGASYKFVVSPEGQSVYLRN